MGGEGVGGWVGGVNVAAGTTPSSRRAKITPLGVVL